MTIKFPQFSLISLKRKFNVSLVSLSTVQPRDDVGLPLKENCRCLLKTVSRINSTVL
jgi:hypothetical protein